MPKKILIIGEVFTDTHLDLGGSNAPLVRLGGVFHMARGLAAQGLESYMAYYAPPYLERDIAKYGELLQVRQRLLLGVIDGAPNVMLISESTEAGWQGYHNILREQTVYRQTNDIGPFLDAIQPTDILILPGRYGTQQLLQQLIGYHGKVHIDFHYDSEEMYGELPIPIETLFLSTSSSLFQDQCHGSKAGVEAFFRDKNIHRILVKENRGGAYCFSLDNDAVYESPAFLSSTMHSVGVGDVYNSAFVAELLGKDVEKNMRFASHCAALYASTMCFDKFQENVNIVLQNIDDYLALAGTRLPWEKRQQYNIYLAAPDFPDVNTAALEQLAESLQYHNFCVHLPVRENGLSRPDMSYNEKAQLFAKDIMLLESCDLLIAVLLYNDPGTLVELGMFCQTGKPTIIYDPFCLCTNMFVSFSPNYLCKSLDEVITATYLCLGGS